MEIFWKILEIFGGVVVGAVLSFVFTSLHYKKVIKREDKIRREELFKENAKKNEEIIINRPQLRVVENPDNIVGILAVRLLPFMNVKLNSLSADDPNNISFDYPDEIYEDSYWDKYEFVVKNIGKTKIDSAFIQISDTKGVNLYSYDLKSLFKFCGGKYYSEREILWRSIGIGESFKFVVYYPKNLPEIKLVNLDLYICDKYRNYWKQDAINIPGDHSDSQPISGEEYSENVNEKIKKTYEFLDCCANLIKLGKSVSYDQKNYKDLTELKNTLWAKEEQFRIFKRQISSGEVLLHSNI